MKTFIVMCGTRDARSALFLAGLPAKGANASDVLISGAMQQYWTNFAKTSDPNGGQLPLGLGFNTSSRAYIQFLDTGPVAKEGLRRAYRDLFLENVDRLMNE